MLYDLPHLDVPKRDRVSDHRWDFLAHGLGGVLGVEDDKRQSRVVLSCPIPGYKPWSLRYARYNLLAQMAGGGLSVVDREPDDDCVHWGPPLSLAGERTLSGSRRRLAPANAVSLTYCWTPVASPTVGAPTTSLDIGLLPAGAGGDAALVERLTRLVNEVYAVAEEGMWVDGATRTTPSEVEELTRAGEIAVARLGGRVVGCVRVQRLDLETGEFGMLAADFAHRSVGAGRELVRFAERTSREDGRSTMQLELLVPREWRHPSKVFLDEWYTRIGYRVVRTGTTDEAYPDLAPLLATPCDFVIYDKPLAGPRTLG